MANISSHPSVEHPAVMSQHWSPSTFKSCPTMQKCNSLKILYPNVIKQTNNPQ